MWKLIVVLSLASCMTATADEAASKPSVSVEFCGRLRDGVMAIGGECTGTTISCERIVWELQLSNEAERQFAEQHNKDTIVVTGRLRKVTGIETKDRWIIDVEKLSKSDSTKDKPSIKMSILGKLERSTSRDDRSISITINSDGQIWPIDLSSNTALTSEANSLIDQQVLLTGTLKQVTKEDRQPISVVQVKSLKRPPRESASSFKKPTW